jgi:hypothetical protein
MRVFAELEMIVNAHSFPVRSPPYSMQLLSRPHNEPPDLHDFSNLTQNAGHFSSFRPWCMREKLLFALRPCSFLLLLFPAILLFFLSREMSFSDKAVFSYIFSLFALHFGCLSTCLSLLPKFVVLALCNPHRLWCIRN